MLDFRKKLGTTAFAKKGNPVEIYDSLDRASDKGPLRPAQEAVLNAWYQSHADKKDVILKLHTGQGKTLVGLLMLQSKLNSGIGPALYLCPNKFLVEQTCDQAKQFGVKFCRLEGSNDIPQDFWDGKAILITHVQILFNGLTKFGIGLRSLHVGCMVLDDSHACIDTIQDAFTIKIPQTNNAYKRIFELFESDLEDQGFTKLEEIRQKEYDVFLPVPYWAWFGKLKELVTILVENKEERSIVFSWNLVKEIIKDCQCIISGRYIEITPYRNPIELFGSFYNADHRIFMSATTNNDSFFIRGLGLNVETIKNPLTYFQEKWSGEKLILIPYLFNYDLDRIEILNIFGRENINRKYGVVALAPSDRHAKLWEAYGAVVTDTSDIDDRVKQLKNHIFNKTIVFSNRYDGIDLPDEACRVLVIDSKPYALSLLDMYHESCRVDSKVIDVKIAQKIEQGLGRAVRGEKDYCIIILTGDDLIKTMRTKSLNKFFSAQTNQQIDIGFETMAFALDETSSKSSSQLLRELIDLVINRDEAWKSFYVERMDAVQPNVNDKDLLGIFELERKAEEDYLKGDYLKAVESIQSILDNFISHSNKYERGWYLQEMARLTYGMSKHTSNEYQISAYKSNRALLKPLNGIEFRKLKLDKNRLENIKAWISSFDGYNELIIEINEMLSNLAFGTKYDKFEQALCDLGKALGFASERPDKEHKKGPDNLWNLRSNEYILFECKNEVDPNRIEIKKEETGQMNNACAWFRANYVGENIRSIMITPAREVSNQGGFNEEVFIMRKKELSSIAKNVRNFFGEFKPYHLNSITEQQIDSYLITHNLTIENILNDYIIKPIQKKAF